MNSLTTSAVTLAAGITMILSTATPAWAGQNVSARLVEGSPRPLVYGAFHHQGAVERLQLVLDCSRQYGFFGHIQGYLEVRDGARKSRYHLARKGQPHRWCGERWIRRDFREGQSVGIQVCWYQRGRDRCTGWRWGIA